MVIDAVKAVLGDSSATYIWRFRYDNGGHRNLCAVFGAADELDVLHGAIRFALFGQPDRRVKAALVHLTDNAGDTWIFDRKDDALRCFRNRQFFDSRTAHCLKTAFSDYSPMGGEQEFSPSHLMMTFDVSQQGEHLQARPHQDKAFALTHLERTAVKKIETNKKVLADFFHTNQAFTSSQLKEIVVFGDSIFRKFKSLTLQSEELELMFSQIKQLDRDMGPRLESELRLLEKIFGVAEPLLAPNKNPRYLQDRLRETEAEFNKLNENGDLERVLGLNSELEWSQILQSLARFLAADKLEKAARKALHEARNSLIPAYELYKGAIEEFLSKDKALLRELEVCLISLQQHVASTGDEPDKQRDNLATKLNRLLGLAQLEHLPPKAEIPGYGTSQLDQARGIVNQSLEILGQVHEDLASHDSIHSTQFQDLEVRYKKILTEYGKAREHWLQLSEQHKIPHDIGLKTLVQWVNLANKYGFVQQKEQRLKEEMAEYNKQLRILVQLLELWRSSTQSQKSSQTELGMVLNEVRAVLQFLPKKKEQLKRLKLLESQIETYHLMKNRLEAETDQIKSRWQEAMNAWGVPSAHNLDLPRWEELSRLVHETLVLDGLCVDASSPIQQGQIFSEEMLDRPMTLYFLKEAPLTNKARVEFLQEVENAEDMGLGLILVGDSVLFEMLCKMGIGQGHRQRQEADVQTKASTQNAKDTSPVIVSDRARAALEIFTGRQSNSVRSPR